VCAACERPIVRGVDATRLDLEAVHLLRDASDVLAGSRYVRTYMRIVVVFVLVATMAAVGGGDWLIPMLFVAIFLVIAQVLTGASQRAKRIASARLKLDEAWARAVAILVRERGGLLSAKELAETTRIPMADAEQILTSLSVDRGIVDIDEEQQLRYRVDVEPLDSPSASVTRANE
jgi:hypothetical protein